MPTGRNPDTMTAQERRDEIAGILARALVHAVRQSRACPSTSPSADGRSTTCLDLSGDLPLSVVPPRAG